MDNDTSRARPERLPRVSVTVVMKVLIELLAFLGVMVTYIAFVVAVFVASDHRRIGR